MLNTLYLDCLCTSFPRSFARDYKETYLYPLGESWALVNGIRNYRPDDGEIQWLVKDNRGLIGLPVWIDRKTNQGTFQRFRLDHFSLDCWVKILAPVTVTKTKYKRKLKG